MSDLKQYAKEIHKPTNSKIVRRSVDTFKPNDIWAIDLFDMSNIKTDNDNITFLLNIVDIYSRYAYSFPLKSKKGSEIVNIFKKLNVLPSNLWADEGGEFFNREFQKFCKDNKINLYHTYSHFKSVYAERFNRTLKELIFYRTQYR